MNPEKFLALGTFGLVMAKYFLKMKRILQGNPLSTMINIYDKQLSRKCVMEGKSSNSCINLLLINLSFCFYHVLGLLLGKCNFLFFNDHATLIFNI